MGIAIKPVTDTRRDDAPTLKMQQGVLRHETSIAAPRVSVSDFEDFLITLLRTWSIPALRLALGVIFLWFGALKVLGVSPVLSLVQQTYSFVPAHPFFFVLGFWEIGIGCGLIFNRALRLTLILLCIHLLGTFVALLQAPSLFFLHDNPLWLTTEGEFVVKNLVLVAAGLVIGGHQVTPRMKGKRIRMVQSK
jgi:putative oxidoreductase